MWEKRTTLASCCKQLCQDKNGQERQGLYLPSRFSVCTDSPEVICPERNSLPSLLQCSSYKTAMSCYQILRLSYFFPSKLGNSSVIELKRSCASSFLFYRGGVLIPLVVAIFSICQITHTHTHLNHKCGCPFTFLLYSHRQAVNHGQMPKD